MASAVASLSGLGGNERFNAEAAAWDSNPLVHEASKQAALAILSRVPSLKPLAGGPASNNTTTTTTTNDNNAATATDDNPPTPTANVLEIGCGTGLLSLRIAPHAHHLVAVDAAEGMIDVLARKLATPGAPPNITPLAALLEDPDDPRLPPADPTQPEGPRLRYDLILSHLVLHHIPDLRAVLVTMYACLAPGGVVALTDFEDCGAHSALFHPRAKLAGVERHGIHPGTMAGLMREVGFVNVRVERAWEMAKAVERFPGEFGDKGKPGEGMGEMRDFPFVVCLGEKEAEGERV